MGSTGVIIDSIKAKRLSWLSGLAYVKLSERYGFQSSYVVAIILFLEQRLVSKPPGTLDEDSFESACRIIFSFRSFVSLQ